MVPVGTMWVMDDVKRLTAVGVEALVAGRHASECGDLDEAFVQFEIAEQAARDVRRVLGAALVERDG